VNRTFTIIGLFLGLLVELCSSSAAQEISALQPVIPPAARGERCVEPTEVMRRDHMKFLLHQRDDTVHSGIRGAKHSLVGCIGCHVQTDPQGAAIAVNADGQFCESCHGFAGVSIDCFECHASVPADGQIKSQTNGQASALPQWMSPPALSMAKGISPGSVP